MTNAAVNWPDINGDVIAAAGNEERCGSCPLGDAPVQGRH